LRRTASRPPDLCPADQLGYWDAEFSYNVDTEADPAKVTVTVTPGPLYHVGAVNVLGPDGQPLSISQGEPKLPLKPGEPARTAPVVATETALLAALGDSGHPFAKVQDRRVEIDRAAQTMDVTYTLDSGSSILVLLRSRASSAFGVRSASVCGRA
jgi:translocation and assembly module TamA